MQSKHFHVREKESVHPKENYNIKLKHITENYYHANYIIVSLKAKPNEIDSKQVTIRTTL